MNTSPIRCHPERKRFHTNIQHSRGATDSSGPCLVTTRHRAEPVSFLPWACVEWVSKEKNKIHVARHIDLLQESSNMVPNQADWTTSARRAWSMLQCPSPGVVLLSACLSLCLSGDLRPLEPGRAHRPGSTQTSSCRLWRPEKFGQTVSGLYLYYRWNLLQFHRVRKVVKCFLISAETVSWFLWITGCNSVTWIQVKSKFSPFLAAPVRR